MTPGSAAVCGLTIGIGGPFGNRGSAETDGGSGGIACAIGSGCGANAGEGIAG